MCDRGFVNHWLHGDERLPLCGVHRRRPSLWLSVPAPRDVTCLVYIRLLKRAGLLLASADLCDHQQKG